MTPNVYSDKTEAVLAVAEEMTNLIKANNAANQTTVLGLATGGTPVPLYQELIRRHKEEGLSFAKVITFNLDEYSGLEKDHPESYWYFMHQQLFNHIDIPAENINLPSGTVAEDEIEAHCAAYEKAIVDAGGLDYQILGIGRTGHIGFNEPPSDDSTRTRQVILHEITRQDAGPAFDGVENVPSKAITMGVATVLDAKRIALMAWGESKADIIAATLKGEITPDIPATYLQSHKNAQFFLDQAAASKL